MYTFTQASISCCLLMYEQDGLDAADRVTLCSGVRAGCAVYFPRASWVIWGITRIFVVVLRMTAIQHGAATIGQRQEEA